MHSTENISWQDSLIHVFTSRNTKLTKFNKRWFARSHLNDVTTQRPNIGQGSVLPLSLPITPALCIAKFQWMRLCLEKCLPVSCLFQNQKNWQHLYKSSPKHSLMFYSWGQFFIGYTFNNLLCVICNNAFCLQPHS